MVVDWLEVQGSFNESAQTERERSRKADKSKYEIYTAVKNEIGKSKNWRQLQERLAEKGITVRFKYKGQTSEIQGVSFSKGEYTYEFKLASEDGHGERDERRGAAL